MRVCEALQSLEKFFSQKKIETPKTDAELLLAFVLGCKRLDLFLHWENLLSESQLDALRALSLRRGKREPLQYITGSVDFFGQAIRVDSRVLIPRPETEELIFQLKAFFAQKQPVRGLDLGTGSGAIAIALASIFPEITMIATDISKEALDLAYDNALQNRLQERIQFVHSDWFQNVRGTFDVIVANPPYLSEKEVQEAQPEVRVYEPKGALISAENGLKDLKWIIKEARHYLNPQGVLVLETGLNQHPSLTDYAKELGYAKVKSSKDLTQRDRFLWCWIN